MKSLKKAHGIHGKKKVQIARDMNMSPQHLYDWFGGRGRVPEHRRLSLERAIGAPVDWDEYNREWTAAQARRDATEPRKISLAPLPPELTEKPVSGPENAPARKKGFWESFLVDDEEEFA